MISMWAGRDKETRPGPGIARRPPYVLSIGRNPAPDPCSDAPATETPAPPGFLLTEFAGAI